MRLLDIFEAEIGATQTITWTRQRGSKKLVKNVERPRPAPALHIRKKIIPKEPNNEQR